MFAQKNKLYFDKFDKTEKFRKNGNTERKRSPFVVLWMVLTAMLLLSAILIIPVGATEDTTPEVPVSGATITKVEMGSSPTKSVYRTGESLNVAGATIKVYYSDKSTKTLPVNSNWCTGFDSSKAGPRTVTVNYPVGGNSVSFTVNVAALAGIKVSALPKKTEYYVGEAEDKKGLVVTQIFTDGSTDILDSGYVTSGFETTTAGQKTITVSFGGFSATYRITVRERTVSKITVSSAPAKTEYFMGDELDRTGLLVTATYNDGSQTDVTEYVTLLGFDTTAVGIRTVTVMYLSGATNFSDTFTITVKIASASGIEITTPAAKTEYLAGEEFDPSGLAVSVVYEDGRKEPVTAVDDIVFFGFASNSLGEKTITVSYGGFSTTFNVNISISPDHVHTEGEFIMILEPTCSSEGSEGSFCVVCGEPVTVRSIPVIEHTYGAWECILMPTETAEGKDIRYCIVCNAADERVLPKLGQILESNGANAVVSGDYVYPAGTLFTYSDIFGVIGGSELMSMNEASKEKLGAEVFSVIGINFTDAAGDKMTPPVPVRYTIPLVGADPYTQITVMRDGEIVDSVITDEGYVVFTSETPGKFAIVGVLKVPKPDTTDTEPVTSAPTPDSQTEDLTEISDPAYTWNDETSRYPAGIGSDGISQTMGTIIIIIVAVIVVGIILAVVYLYMIKRYY